MIGGHSVDHEVNSLVEIDVAGRDIMQHRCVPLSVVDSAISYSSWARDNRTIRVITDFDDEAESLFIISGGVVVASHFHRLLIEIWQRGDCVG